MEKIWYTFVDLSLKTFFIASRDEEAKQTVETAAAEPVTDSMDAEIQLVEIQSSQNGREILRLSSPST